MRAKPHEFLTIRDGRQFEDADALRLRHGTGWRVYAGMENQGFGAEVCQVKGKP
jgi:hypothetical protein